jgi:hypothetical protein
MRRALLTRVGGGWARLRRAAHAAATLAFAGTVSLAGAAQSGAAASGNHGSTAPSLRSGRELPPLPKAPSLVLPAPDPETLEQLTALLSRLVSDNTQDRSEAAAELRTLSPRFVPAIDRTLAELAEKADRGAMETALTRARRDAKTTSKAEDDEGAGDEAGRLANAKGAPLDHLEVLVAKAHPDSKPWRDLVSVIGLSRALVGIGTPEAVRELIDVYTRFGEFLRVDTQVQLGKLGDRALPGLIEARRHKAEKIARWAERQLDVLGKAIPSEVVQTAEPEVLADILRAYGRTRDPDAARIVVSFASSERGQVRDAARQAISSMGEVANWQLREGYENVVGKRPARDWAWDRTARELFAELDRLRLAKVYDLFEAGLAAREKGDLKAMRQSFDALLAKSPLFEHRSELAAGYLEFAEKASEEGREDALLALRRVTRISDDDALKKRAESLLLTLEAERALTAGVADTELYRRAVELNPENARARDGLARLEREPVPAERETLRFTVAGVIAAFAALAMLAVALMPRWMKRAEAPAPAATPDQNEPLRAPPSDSESPPGESDVEKPS